MPTRLVVALGFVLAMFLTNSAHAQVQFPVVSIVPTQNAWNSPAPFRDACLSPSSWPTGWTRAHLVGNAYQFIDQMTNGEQAQCFWNITRLGRRSSVIAPR
jgi:hypothetical protein